MSAQPRARAAQAAREQSRAGAGCGHAETSSRLQAAREHALRRAAARAACLPYDLIGRHRGCGLEHGCQRARRGAKNYKIWAHARTGVTRPARRLLPPSPWRRTPGCVRLLVATTRAMTKPETAEANRTAGVALGQPWLAKACSPLRRSPGAASASRCSRASPTAGTRAPPRPAPSRADARAAQRAAAAAPVRRPAARRCPPQRRPRASSASPLRPRAPHSARPGGWHLPAAAGRLQGGGRADGLAPHHPHAAQRAGVQPLAEQPCGCPLAGPQPPCGRSLARRGQISDSLRRFGVGEDTRALLVARFDGTEEEVRGSRYHFGSRSHRPQLEAVCLFVVGTRRPLADLESLVDAAALQKARVKRGSAWRLRADALRSSSSPPRRSSRAARWRRPSSPE